MVKINGIEEDIIGITLSDYLESSNYDKSYIAIEKNGNIVPKDQYDIVVLRDNDSLEIVSFVGGG